MSTTAPELLRFTVDGAPDSLLGLGRLSSYLRDLAALSGDPAGVRVVGLTTAPLVLTLAADASALYRLRQRLSALRRGDARPEAVQALHSLDTRLAADRCKAVLSGERCGELFRFLGRDRPDPVLFGPVATAGALTGVLIRIGGKREDVVPVHLRDGDTTHFCSTNETVALSLAPHYRLSTLRVFGQGRWQRSVQGRWSMDRFFIDGFEVMDDRPVLSVLAQLRAGPPPGWRDGGKGGGLAGFRRLRVEDGASAPDEPGATERVAAGEE